jgi:hypothetical protein
MRNWERLAFALALFVFVFLGGIVVGKYQYWPYDALNQAKDAARAMWVAYFPDEKPVFNTPYKKGGVTRWEQGAAQDGLTFLPMFTGTGAGAVLVDMQGKELHRWKLNFSDAFPGDAPHIVSRAPDERIGWHGVHLYPNGDIVLNLEGGNFPAGGGLVMIDRDSKIKWKLARNTHHDLDVLPDGRIVVLAHDYVTDGIPACADYVKAPFLADKVLIVSPEGKELESFSLAEAFCKSPFKWTMMPIGTLSQKPPVKADAEDFQHTNNVQVIRPEEAAVFPGGQAGDYLVSFRNLNMIAVVDQKTHLVKWAMNGIFARQHDPDILPNGNILIYDNLGGMIDGNRPQGRSRVLEIDPKSQQIVWKYDGGTAPEDRFDSSKGGNVQKLPNGNVLVSHSWQGRVFEVTGDTNPRIVWEYINLLGAGEEGGHTAPIVDARRLAPSDVPFLEAPVS